jgi:glycosyltransferase involved in cell wall biosynthesis
MTTPAISVVMPVYNGEATVERAVRSILVQDAQDWELVAVDDGSTDATAAILARLASEDQRVRLIRAPHGGIVPALNRGLAESRAALIARMDADDVAYPGRLGTQRALLEARPELGLVACRVAHAGEPGRETTGYALHVDWLNEQITEQDIALHRFVESPLAHPSVMFRRELVDRLGGYREGPFPEDYELWLRWLDAGVRMAKVPETLLVWHDPPGRLSRTHPCYSVEAFYRLKAHYLARWLARHNPRHPEVVVWGAGKTSRQRSAHLEAEGCRIVGFIDIDPRKRGRTAYGRPIFMPEDIAGPEFGFVVSYVGKRGAGELIRAQLVARGYVEGRDFLLAA